MFRKAFPFYRDDVGFPGASTAVRASSSNILFMIIFNFIKNIRAQSMFSALHDEFIWKTRTDLITVNIMRYFYCIINIYLIVQRSLLENNIFFFIRMHCIRFIAIFRIFLFRAKNEQVLVTVFISRISRAKNKKY